MITQNVDLYHDQFPLFYHRSLDTTTPFPLILKPPLPLDAKCMHVLGKQVITQNRLQLMRTNTLNWTILESGVNTLSCIISNRRGNLWFEMGKCNPVWNSHHVFQVALVLDYSTKETIIWQAQTLAFFFRVTVTEWSMIITPTKKERKSSVATTTCWMVSGQILLFSLFICCHAIICSHTSWFFACALHCVLWSQTHNIMG